MNRLSAHQPHVRLPHFTLFQSINMYVASLLTTYATQLEQIGRRRSTLAETILQQYTPRQSYPLFIRY